MPVRFSVVPDLNLVLFVYSGTVCLAESTDAIAEAARDLDYRPFMRQLCDLSAVTGVERNFPELLKMQARILDELMPRGHEITVVFLAPTRAGREMAQMASKSWAGLNAVRVLIVETEAGAADILGLDLIDLATLSSITG